MSRKLTAAALALSVAGGVYLSAGQAHASNMGFKLERSFPTVRQTDNLPATPFLNIYLLSFPLFNGLGDVGSDGLAGHPTRGCVGDAGGPATGDGVINSQDALCDVWTDRAIAGAFVFSRFNRDTCAYIGTTGLKTSFGAPVWGGTIFDLERDAGFYLTVSSTVVSAPANRAVVVGSHDPSYTGRQIRSPASACSPANDIINLPYHSMYQKPSEILCGLEGVDWNRLPGDKADRCANGIFDDAVSKKTISVLTFDNVKDSSVTTRDNNYSARGMSYNSFTREYVFTGSDYDLTPGDAYIVSITPGHQPTTFLSPHF